ncbi:dihydroorotate oxidase [Ancylostoma ceylanicum]|uniref:Dihydroorotate dehydrogenase (quinone), mitochondrial n=1 Tax=Ancylostoma ceylanicum TaxID=53326 RepID=A0A0D6M8W7_9BILA|nr:dihydroorotate oxidase [Ancylostoma ceylanicum]
MFPKPSPRHISKSTMLFIGGGMLGYGALEMLWSSETFQSKAVGTMTFTAPGLFQLMPLINHYCDEEASHDLAVRVAAWGLFPRFGTNRKEYPELNCEFLGKTLKNPIGLAAGFDKNGEAIRSLAELSGFGLVEIGSVTPIPQKGDARPREFRLQEDEGIISRYGFNNDGVGKVQKRVREARTEWMDDFAMFGVNIANNRLTDDAKLDYEIGVNYFAAYSDYIVINVSSPESLNLLSAQKKCELQKLLVYVKHTVDLMKLQSRPKVLLKIPPDLGENEKKDIAQMVTNPRHGIDALIVSDTTMRRPDLLKSGHSAQVGGLSGAPLRRISTECIRDMYRFTNGRVPIVGCGGISSGADAYEKIRAGASVKRELAELLRRDGYTNVSQAVGTDHRV